MRETEFQRFTAALVDPVLPVPSELVSAAAANLQDRFAVYRNTVHVSLVEALSERFPIVRTLVGEEFFRGMARSFVQDHKPEQPILSTYGNGFAPFIAAFEPARELPYLADVARLEIAWSEAWAAADATALNLSDLAKLKPKALSAARFKAHPAARLLTSAWPITGIWRLHQLPDPDLSTLLWRSESALITRPAAELQLLPMDASLAAFAAMLLDKQTVADAAQSAHALDPQFDPGKALGTLIDAGTFMQRVRR
jgi:hypothetical protein